MAHEALKAKEIDEKMSEDQENFKAFLSSYQTSDDDLVSALEKGVKETVIQYEAKDTEKQKIVYMEWEKKREEELVKQLAELARLERLAEIEEKKKYLQEKEERLYFFDNEHEWELKIEENRPRYVKRWFGKKKKKRVIDEGYVPPEIGRVGNNA
jgi:small subunit ribosomal protein S27